MQVQEKNLAPYGPKSQVAYADPGYQSDKKARYPVDTAAHTRSAWSYINQKGNAGKYTAAQLKRVKGRIMAAMKKFGIKVASSEDWAAGHLALTESIAEVFEDQGGSFSVSLNNGAVCVTVSSYCVDPCDLDVIGTAAMKSACLALGNLDPDMDGDIDIPGADGEDDDGDNDDQMTYTPPGESAPAEAVTETTTDPAPKPAAEPHTETEVPAMADTATPAVEASPAAATDTTETAPAPAPQTFTFEQVQALLAARPATETAPVAAETAPAAPAPVVPAAAVAETQEQRMTRLSEMVDQRLAEAAAAQGIQLAETDEQIMDRLLEAKLVPLRQAAAEQGRGVQRQGFTTGRVNENVAPGATGSVATNSHGMPSGAPDKPLHQYSDEELAVHGHPLLVGHAFGDRAYKLG